MHYTTESRRDDAIRHASVHHMEVGAIPRFLATCQNNDRSRWFRLAGVSNARFDRVEPYREQDPERIAAVERNRIGGFHTEGPPVTFFVRQPEAAWVKRNLLRGMKHEPATNVFACRSTLSPCTSSHDLSCSSAKPPGRRAQNSRSAWRRLHRGP